MQRAWVHAQVEEVELRWRVPNLLVRVMMLECTILDAPHDTSVDALIASLGSANMVSIWKRLTDRRLPRARPQFPRQGCRTTPSRSHAARKGMECGTGVNTFFVHMFHVE